MFFREDERRKPAPCLLGRLSCTSGETSSSSSSLSSSVKIHHLHPNHHHCDNYCTDWPPYIIIIIVILLLLLLLIIKLIRSVCRPPTDKTNLLASISFPQYTSFAEASLTFSQRWPWSSSRSRRPRWPWTWSRSLSRIFSHQRLTSIFQGLDSVARPGGVQGGKQKPARPQHTILLPPR